MENQPFQQKPISARNSGQQRPPQRPTPPRMPQRQPIQTQRPPQQPPRQPQNQNPKKKKKGVGYRRRRNALLILLALIIVIVLICTRCSSCRSISKGDGVQVNAPTEVTTQDASAATEAASDATEATTEETAKSGTVHVVAAGDNFVQTSVYNSAAAHAENGETYNFAYVYDGVKDLVNGSNADLRIINQETLICDNPDIEISGSNFNFNSPPEAGEAIVDLGFNVVSMCNNHLLDKGVEGLTSCMDYWDRLLQEHSDLLTYGVYRDVDDMNNIRIKEVNGLKVAFLAYTENINGYTVPDDSTIQITLTTQDDVIQEQIERANELADIVVVSAHWGDEDTFEVRDGVKAQAQNMIEWGADVIIGNHPHVPQTMEYITRSDGTQGFVFYAMGNFVSAQTFNINLISEVADFDLVYHEEDKQVTVENVQVHPIITQYDDGSLSNLRLIAYKDYTEELAEEHGLPYAMSGEYGIWNMDKIKEIIDTAIPAEFQKLD